MLMTTSHSLLQYVVSSTKQKLLYNAYTASISQANPIFSTLESRNAGNAFGLVTTTDADLDEVNRVAFYYFIGNFVLCNITSC